MSDKQFLQWIHDRLINVHNELPSSDYMRRLRSIIKQTSSTKESKPRLKS